jgi:hypothetical protein
MLELFNKTSRPPPLLDTLVADPTLFKELSERIGLHVEDLRFLLRYGGLNTHHLLIANNLDISLQVSTLLEAHDPLTVFRVLQAVDTPDYLQGTKDRLLEINSRAMVASVECAKETSHALGKQYNPTAGKSVAYLQQQEVGERDVPVIIDTGCSVSITPFKSDFITPIQKADCSQIKGFAEHTSPIEGIGWIEWPIVDMLGNVALIRTSGYYVPSADIRLFSPQTYFQEQGNGKGTFDKDKITLHLPSGTDLEFPYHCCSNLPYMIVNPHKPTAGLTSTDKKLCLGGFGPTCMNLTAEENKNITRPQKELLLWHC